LNVKDKKTGGALALTKWLLGQVKGPVGKFPRTLYGKKALIQQIESNNKRLHEIQYVQAATRETLIQNN